MNEKAFDHLQEYIDHMLPERRERLMNLPIYQAYHFERRRLSSLLCSMLTQNRPLTDTALIAEAHKLEAMAERALSAAKRLDPYGD